MTEQGTDEFGLPTHITEDEREVTGKEPSHQHEVNLLEMSADIDKVRIILRCGVEIILEESWHTGVAVLMIKNTKGQRPFAIYDPRLAGQNALRYTQPEGIF